MLTGGLDEVSSNGVETYPDSQVLAVRICLDANGNENPLETIGDCQHGRSLDSFLVFSVASRIEGDSMTVDSATLSGTRDRKLELEQMRPPLSESENDIEDLFRALFGGEATDGSKDDRDLSRLDFRQLAFTDINFGDGSSSSSRSWDNPDNQIPGGDPTTEAPSPGTTTGVSTETAAPKVTTATPVATTSEPPSPSTASSDPITQTPVSSSRTTSTPDATTQPPPVTTSTPDTTTQTPESTTQTPTATPSSESISGSDQAASTNTSSATTGIAMGSTSVLDSVNATSSESSKVYRLSVSATSELRSVLTRKAYLKNA